MGGASQSQLKCFSFEQHSTPKLSDVGKDAQDHTFKNSEVFDIAASFVCCHNQKGGGAPETARKYSLGSSAFVHCAAATLAIADLIKLGDNVSAQQML